MTRRVPLGAALFFAFLIATLAVSVLVVRARTPDLVLEVLDPQRCFAFSPRAEEAPTEARITFFVRRSDPAAAVTVVDSGENVVRTLDDAVDLEAEEAVTYIWDGRNDEGAIVAPGRYRLGVELPESDRTMVWPVRMTVRHGASPPPIAVSSEGGCVAATGGGTP